MMSAWGEQYKSDGKVRTFLAKDIFPINGVDKIFIYSRHST